MLCAYFVTHSDRKKFNLESINRLLFSLSLNFSKTQSEHVFMGCIMREI